MDIEVKLSEEVRRLNTNIEKLLKESKRERIKNCVVWVAFLVFLLVLGMLP